MSTFDISGTQRCAHYVKVQPLGEGIPFTFLPNIVIGLRFGDIYALGCRKWFSLKYPSNYRVYALYGRNKWIGIILATYFTAELGVALWIYLLPSIHPVPLPASSGNDTIAVLHLCLATVSNNLSELQAAAFQFMQTFYDSMAFGLIIFRTLRDAMQNNGTDTLRTLIAKHGLVYYVLVFTTNFTWAMMIIFSPPGLKYACAAPTLMLACVSVNRLTLSLRGFSEQEAAEQLRTRSGAGPLALEQSPRLRRRRSWIGTSTFEIGSRLAEDTMDFNSFALYSRDTKLGSGFINSMKA
ncbi:hypothetical protein SCHPADRAFT_894327 [Schizopora paradoxa]|uniref:Uncharacterized protein n=1 Tax=Schizopora paradoxa TaxID=27342 RepID=A0A0H2R7Q1_9AGAM|nr:hypothetical protein SCHPADRAFT_894327 [Schizopora paradoxa]